MRLLSFDSRSRSSSFSYRLLRPLQRLTAPELSNNLKARISVVGSGFAELCEAVMPLRKLSFRQ
jgi:hypothetical protein